MMWWIIAGISLLMIASSYFWYQVGRNSALFDEITNISRHELPAYRYITENTPEIYVPGPDKQWVIHRNEIIELSPGQCPSRQFFQDCEFVGSGPCIFYDCVFMMELNRPECHPSIVKDVGTNCCAIVTYMASGKSQSSNTG